MAAAKTQETALAAADEQALAKARMRIAERFTTKMMNEFSSSVGGMVQVTDYQRQLIQGYFISIDRALKNAEEERSRKNENNRDHKYDNDLPVIWDNVNLTDLALDVVHYARMGLDMMQKNHLFPIPYKNNKTKKYDVTLMPGYNGVQYVAEKYALEKPLAVTIELVYSTDTFRPIKKSAGIQVESYEFSINNAFDRGEVIGGFGYIEYQDPLKNKLVIMTRRDIEKRKPKYASANFWGGKQKVWENGKQVEQESDGWFEEMCLKTIKREVYSPKHIPIDPRKVDDNYQYLKMREAKLAEMEAQDTIDTYANGDIIDTTPPAIPAPEPPTAIPSAGYEVDPSTGEVIGEAAPAAITSRRKPVQAPAAPVSAPSAPVSAQNAPAAATEEAQTTLGGPDF